MQHRESWGRYPKSEPGRVAAVNWTSDSPDFGGYPGSVLPYGKGRSYGDCCLNNGGTLLHTQGLDRFIRFDPGSGVLRCEAGVSLHSVLGLVLPKGWFLPVTPGTQFVSLGGAVANDVHGKNHHRASSFGCHVTAMEVLRSDGERVVCTPEHNADFFSATIGGLGLTGLILWVELQLKPVEGPFIDSEQIRFSTLEEFFELSADSDKTNEYTVAWVDCVSRGSKLGRGIFIRGNHAAKAGSGPKAVDDSSGIGIDAPEFLINRASMRVFNSLYFHAQRQNAVKRVVPYDKFFYPLDVLPGWNRLYGRRGFLQYQFVVPFERKHVLQDVLRQIERSGQACTLSVLKVFGDVRSPGMLSFPRPGATFALDFPMQGQSTLDLCESFDEMVRQNGGAVYPAKDARMSASSYQAYFPRWKEFLQFCDPRFSSNFWRRVTATS